MGIFNGLYNSNKTIINSRCDVCLANYHGFDFFICIKRILGYLMKFLVKKNIFT